MIGKKLTSAAVIVGLLAASASSSALADNRGWHGNNVANVAAAVLGVAVVGSLIANASRPAVVQQPVYSQPQQGVYYDAPQAVYSQPQQVYYAQPAPVYYAPQPVYYAQPAVSISYGYNGGYYGGRGYHHYR